MKSKKLEISTFGSTSILSLLTLAVIFSIARPSTALAASASLAAPETPRKCESVSSIKARAVDEICDYFVDASEDCFSQLNEKFTSLKTKADSKPLTKDLINEAQKISAEYMTAISILESYRKNMGVKTCGDQMERVRVMIEETRTDLKDLSALISNTKMRK
jgi:hypothetical protein